jgi:hypothetical protein
MPALSFGSFVAAFVFGAGAGLGWACMMGLVRMVAGGAAK